MRKAVVLGTMLVTFAAGAETSGEPSKDACVEAYRSNQSLRREGRLLEATKDLLVCAHASCPAIVQTDCVAWLRETQAMTPSISIREHGSPPPPSMRVFLDGRSLPEAANSQAIEVDPGEHVLAFERPGSGHVERRILVMEGEKGRVIEVDLPPAVLPRNPSHPMPVAALALGGLGVASLGLGGVFGVIGLSRRGDLGSCKPACSPERIEEVSSRFVIADVAFAIGAVSLAAALVLYLTRPPSSPGSSPHSP
jgi:hypothetical protein